MNKFLKLTVFFFTVFFYYTVVAQQFGSLRGDYKISFPEKIQGILGDPLSAGTYTVGVAGDFPTIDSAFNKLSTDGIAGSVYLELIDTFYTAPTNETGFLLNGPISGANPNNNISIIHGVDKNVTIEGSGKFVLTFMNASYVNLDPIIFGRYRGGSITIHALHNTQFNRNSCIGFINNSDHNVVQNLTIIDEDNERTSVGIGFIALNSSPFECPDSNLIFNNFIQKAAWGIYMEGSYGTPRGTGNIIRGNFIGSEIDSLIGWGIQLVYCQNTLVDSNVIQNLKLTANFGSSGDVMNLGINSYWGSGDIIRNNIVHNIKNNSGYTSTGILLSGSPGESGSNNLIYNNMVYDIKSTSTSADNRVAGIQMWNQNNSKVYYNSVYLSGTGQNKSGSAALYIYNQCTNVEAKNNVFVNTRNESPYCASSIYNYSTSNLTSNYNDLYYSQNQNNCMVRIGGSNYNTLADWQIASGQDANSISKEVFFDFSKDLHLTGSSDGDDELAGTPITGITTDIDGEDRGTNYPYMGADEGTIPLVVPVELTSFTAISQLGKVILNWSTATEINNLGFEIERASSSLSSAPDRTTPLFNIWIRIGFKEGYGTTTEPREYSFVDDISSISANSLAYRLKQIDFDGSYAYSDEILIDNLAPTNYDLHQNYPNPFNPSTIIEFDIPTKLQVSLKIFNSIGELVAELVNEEKLAGSYEVTFNANNLPSGVYFYQLKTVDFIEIKKMILMK